MKIIQTILFLVIGFLLNIASSHAEEAGESLAIITNLSTGQEFKADILEYNSKEKIWIFYFEGSESKHKFRDSDVLINTPVGVLYPGENSSLCINTGDDTQPIQLSQEDIAWYVVLVPTESIDEPLARVRVQKTGKKFEVPFQMAYDFDSELWTFHCEDDLVATRHFGALDVEITTSAGNILAYYNSIWFYWPKGDWRANKLPVKFSCDDGHWVIAHGLIGEDG